MPVPPVAGFGADGLTVGEPPVAVVLPVSPALQPDSLELVVAEPEMFLRLDLTSGGASGVGGSLGEGGGAAGVAALQLRVVELTAPPSGARPASLEGDAWLIVLEWTGPAGGRFVVDSSADLTQWFPEEAELLSAEAGQFRARCVAPRPGARFYRVRQLP